MSQVDIIRLDCYVEQVAKRVIRVQDNQDLSGSNLVEARQNFAKYFDSLWPRYRSTLIDIVRNRCQSDPISFLKIFCSFSYTNHQS